MEKTRNASDENEPVEITGDLKCLTDFQCYQSGFEVLWQAKDVAPLTSCSQDGIFKWLFA
jgi:hypothetical protein